MSIETREIADEELDNVAGGLGVGIAVEGLQITGTPGPGGLPVITGSAKSVSLTVTDIQLPGAGA
ncbi:hypothetical protein DVA86_13775 [Streptomyces armeniacus]|uniref:Type A2 lantipeptide n=1 Tax=Streptomyces armeniacus TaxID=83291 RepID=A0A345XPJ2_9ACTN|nr:hypothetical protein [Streptomyces armeniacus]AXK33558.1 hypothetical protein DVA86_13775 [Streptomyces armeniacus]